MKTKYLNYALIAVIITLVGGASRAQAGVIQDDINGNATPGFFVFFDASGLSSDLNIGWHYSPTTAYNLDRIETTFRSVPNGSAFTRSVTMSIWDAHPGSGGLLLQSGSFNVGTSGGAQGISFSEIELSAGHNYFIGLNNILGLGINIVKVQRHASVITPIRLGNRTELELKRFVPLALLFPIARRYWKSKPVAHRA